MVGLDLSPVDVGQEVADAAHLFHPQAEEKGLEFTVDVPEEPIVAEIDEFCLERIVNNLLSNAIKFTDEGRVTVVVTACEEEIVLAVRDTGVGIEKEFQPLLFDEFRQESVGDDREHGGVGLGLAITKRMVDLLGGSIEVESKKGTGTTFTVHLPREADPQITSDAGTGEIDRTNGRSDGHGENGSTDADRPIYQVERETHIRLG
jgi:signal transduction histidine kinase